MSKGLWRVVAHPHFKQVAQDEQGVSRGVQQVIFPGLKRGGFARVQVHIGDEIHPLPRAVALDVLGAWRGHGWIKAQRLFQSPRLLWARLGENLCVLF